MRKAIRWIPVFSAALALPALAQGERDVKTGGKGKEETLKLLINGGIDVAFDWESGQLREVEHWIPGGIPDASAIRLEKLPNYLFNGPVWVRFTASLQDNVELDVMLRSVPYSDNKLAHPPGVQPASEFSGVTDRFNWGDQVFPPIGIKYAYVKIKELFDPAWSLSFGQQDILWDVRGRGNAVFLDVAHAKSPWGEVGRQTAVTVRDESNPVGAKLAYSRDQVNVELGVFPIIQDVADVVFLNAVGIHPSNSAQQAIYYIDGMANLDSHGSKFGAIATLFHGVEQGDDVFTIGVSAVLSPQKDFELFAEGYYQFGQAWTGGKPTLSTLTFVQDGKQEAYLFLGGGRMEVPGDTAFFVEAHFLLISGQNNGGFYETTNAGNGFGYASALGQANLQNHRAFMGYGNYQVMLLLDDHRWGFGFDNNILQVDAQAGVMLSTGTGMKNNLRFIGKVAYAMAPQKWIVNSGAGDVNVSQYGYEIDAAIQYYFNKNANLYISGGYLFGSDIIKQFSFAGDNTAWVFLLGVQAQN